MERLRNNSISMPDAYLPASVYRYFERMRSGNFAGSLPQYYPEYNLDSNDFEFDRSAARIHAGDKLGSLATVATIRMGYEVDDTIQRFVGAFIGDPTLAAQRPNLPVHSPVADGARSHSGQYTLAA